MSSAAEYDALTRDAGWSNLATRTQIELRGKDRATFLHNMCTNQIVGRATGDSCEAFLTNPQGKTLGYVYVHIQSDSLLLDSAAGQAERLLTHFDRYLIREDVELIDRSAAWNCWLLAGPRAEAVVQSWGWQLPAACPGNCAFEFEGDFVSLRRIPYLGAGTLMISGPDSLGERLTALCRQQHVVTCSAEVVDARRIEVGTPLYGVDIDEANLPQEVNRDQQAISFTKGCYIGQETVARIDALGHVNRRLVGLELEGSEIPAAGTLLTMQGKQVATITSACYSPALQAPLALAYVRREHQTAGTVLTGDAISARVVQLPL